MIISANPKPELSVFEALMQRTDRLLNEQAQRDPTYYETRNGSLLEDDVFSALDECAKGTVFEKTIEKVSGQRFPDITAAKLYGVEVKSTKKDQWTSTGSSILETTRLPNIERIFMTFGKLGGRPILFLSRPYEECLSDIAVTHMPRYKIDMRLLQGDTIFDRMKIPYERLRNMDNPIAPVVSYYREHLKSGESLWWINDQSENALPPIVKLWTSLSSEEKKILVAYGYVLFPEVVKGNDPDKYSRYALWLVTHKGIVNTNIRDSFSAGGKIVLQTSQSSKIAVSASFGKIITEYKSYILHLLRTIDSDLLREQWGRVNEKYRILQWCEQIATVATGQELDFRTAMSLLSANFPIEKQIPVSRPYFDPICMYEPNNSNLSSNAAEGSSL
ncbi:MAG: hypothetical protein IKR48_00015 [Kiritimatiellae bacterium]|nr:hypothetical protein [Kiritimatiellia bacterium]